MNDIILYFANKYFGDWERIYDAIEEQEDVDFDELEMLKEKYEGQYVTVLDEDYPINLKHISRPPFCLFFKGNKELLYSRNKIWYYGNYYNDDYNDVAIQHFKESTKEDITLISGYTSEFERRYINNINPTGVIIVRDAGIDSYINMTRIEEEHFIKDNLIVSEYPDKVIPSLYTWSMSSRIKAGLSDGMVLLNSLKEKTTFKFISEAIDERKTIYCYEPKVDEKSHNYMLISKGAYAITKLKETRK